MGRLGVSDGQRCVALTVLTAPPWRMGQSMCRPAAAVSGRQPVIGREVSPDAVYVASSMLIMELAFRSLCNLDHHRQSVAGGMTVSTALRC